MNHPLRGAEPAHPPEDDVVSSSALSVTLCARAAYDVIQGLLDALCLHEGWVAAAYWTADGGSPGQVSLFATSGVPAPARVAATPQPSRAVRQAFITRDLVIDPITDALLAVPLVHEDRVVGVVASGGAPPVVTTRRAEVLLHLASRSAAALGFLRASRTES